MTRHSIFATSRLRGLRHEARSARHSAGLPHDRSNETSIPSLREALSHLLSLRARAVAHNVAVHQEKRAAHSNARDLSRRLRRAYQRLLTLEKNINYVDATTPVDSTAFGIMDSVYAELEGLTQEACELGIDGISHENDS